MNLTDSLIIDREWLDRDIGEPQVKGLAEVLRVNIEVIDASKLDDEPHLYSARPEVSSPRTGGTVLVETRSKEPSRLLLYREHYYPLFPKGKYPNRRPMPGKDNFGSVGFRKEEFRTNEILSHEDCSPPTRSSDQTEVAPQTRKPAEEEIWDFVSSRQLHPVKKGDIYNLLGTNFKEREVYRSMAADGGLSGQNEESTLNSDQTHQGSTFNVILGKTDYRPSIPKTTSLYGLEAKPSVSKIDTTRNGSLSGWVTGGIGAAAVGLVALAGFCVDYFLSRSRRKAIRRRVPRKRVYSDDSIQVGTKW